MEGIEEFDLGGNEFGGEEKDGLYYERKQRREGGKAWCMVARLSDGQEITGRVRPEAVWELHLVEMDEQICRL